MSPVQVREIVIEDVLADMSMKHASSEENSGDCGRIRTVILLSNKEQRVP